MPISLPRPAPLLAAALLGLCVGAGPATAQSIIYVDLDARGADDGSSWADAFEELDDALEAAVAPAQLWVAEGTYYPTDDPDRDASFFLKSGVEVLGGFTGTETRADQRTPDPDEGGTVLSGDIGVPDDPSDNSYHVVTAVGVDNTAVLDGFLVTAGNADGSVPNNFGGGLVNVELSSVPKGYPTLRNVAFEGNAAVLGGGMFLDRTAGTVVLEDVEFKENEALIGGGLYSRADVESEGVEFEENAAAERGGGAAFLGGTVVLRDVEFDSNTAGDDDAPETPGRGAGFYTQDDPAVTVIGAEFERNRCFGFFGDGAGFLAQGGTVDVVNARFFGNTARAGAAFMARNGSPTMSLTNIEVAGNQGAEDTWGVIDLNESTETTIAHLTMSGNDGFTMLRAAGSTVTEIGNAIVWDNDHDEAPALLSDLLAEGGGSLEVDHAIVEGGFPDGEAIFSDDPLFFAAPDDGPDDVWGTDDDDYGDLRLQPGSPAIALGDLDLVPEDRFDLDDDGVTTELVPFDLDGERRVQDGSVELGAYEGTGTPVATETGAAGPGPFALLPSSPNPTRGLARLTLVAAEAGPVTVAVYDALGRRVLRLHDGPLAAGAHPLTVDGGALAAGLYVVRAVSPTGLATRRLTVVR